MMSLDEILGADDTRTGIVKREGRRHYSRTRRIVDGRVIDVELLEVKAKLHTVAVRGFLVYTSPLWHEQTWSLLIGDRQHGVEVCPECERWGYHLVRCSRGRR